MAKTAMKASPKAPLAMKTVMKSVLKAKGHASTEADVPKPVKRPATKLTADIIKNQKGVKSMSLGEKLEAWKAKGDIEAPLPELDHAEQKRLSSKFLNALKGAPDDVASQYSKISEMPAGKKTQSKQLMVKSWIMDKQWGDQFIEMNKTLDFKFKNKRIERPQTMKELEAKYDEDEIADLLASGGISEIRHQKSSRVKMYIDHGLWEKEKEVEKRTSVSSKQSKAAEDEEVECFNKSFKTMSMDIDHVEDFFLQEAAALEGPGDDTLSTVGKKQKTGLLQIMDDDDVDKAAKLIKQASNLLNNKQMSFEALVEGLKKHKHYQKGLKDTSNALIVRMDELKDKCKLYIVSGASFKMMKNCVGDVAAVLKDVATHTGLLRRL